MNKLLFVILFFLGCCVLSFFATAGLLWLICWAFGRMWSWRAVVGVWAILWIVSGSVGSIAKGLR